MLEERQTWREELRWVSDRKELAREGRVHEKDKRAKVGPTVAARE